MLSNRIECPQSLKDHSQLLWPQSKSKRTSVIKSQTFRGMENETENQKQISLFMFVKFPTFLPLSLIPTMRMVNDKKTKIKIETNKINSIRSGIRMEYCGHSRYQFKHLVMSAGNEDVVQANHACYSRGCVRLGGVLLLLLLPATTSLNSNRYAFGASVCVYMYVYVCECVRMCVANSSTAVMSSCV